MSRRALAVVTALIGLVAFTVGCGLPSDDSAQGIDPDGVPFDLLAPASTTVPDTPQSGDTQIANVFFQNDERLIAVPVEVAGSAAGEAFDPAAAVTQLLEGTGGLGVPAGVRSAIPSGTRLRSAEISGDTINGRHAVNFVDVHQAASAASAAAGRRHFHGSSSSRRCAG